jgi:hypothetical protein
MSGPNLDDYVDVAERLRLFYERYPDGSLQPANHLEPYRIEEVAGELRLTYVALAFRHPEDPRPGVGVAWEPLPGRTPYTRGSEVMVAETSAWGRAIASLGIATKRSVASRQEVATAEARRQPPSRRPESAPEPTAKVRKVETPTEAQRAAYARFEARQAGQNQEASHAQA